MVASHYPVAVGVRRDRIAAAGAVAGTAVQEMDAAGLVLGRGFVDPRSDADLNVLQHPAVENLVIQGVTTSFGGNRGHSRVLLLDLKYAGR